MSGIGKLLGDTLLKSGSDDTQNTADLAKQDFVVGLYFSAHWCPPCRGFTPKLVEFYKKFTSANPGKLEIVFISSDRSEDDFKSYFNEMPWLSLPYDNKDLRMKLSKKFKVQGIPTLVFLKAENGELITGNGREKVMKDPEGKNFPWTPPTVADLMGGELVSKTGPVNASTALEGSIRGLYFSAHWCGPCRGFTPKLIESYKKLKENGKNFEIVFISWDNDEDEFEEYYKDMPWLAINKEEAERIDGLNELFEIEGIPSLVILDENNKVITTRGRSVISVDPEGKDFPWFPKPFEELREDTADAINENAALIVLTDGAEAEAQKAIEILEPISTSYAEERKSNEEIPVLSFFYEGPKTGNLAQTTKKFTGYSDLAAPAVIFINIEDEVKYKRDSASKEDIQDIVNLFKAGKLETTPLRE